MKTAYLPIRSFGDFIITAAVIKHNFWTRVPIILPPYLLDIFDAIGGDEYFEIIDTIDYDDQPAFFELYKVKDLKNFKRLLRDTDVIATFVRNNQAYLLDYHSRRLFFTGAKFIWPAKGENIYEGKFRMLQTYGLVAGDMLTPKPISEPSSGLKQRIIILPDSRISAKKISSKLINAITSGLADCSVDTAYFSKSTNQREGDLYYADFESLIRLILSYDLIVSAESLPYHLAYFYRKRHFVVYNPSRHFKSAFMTPYMLQYGSYAIFDGADMNAVVQQILRVLISPD